MENSMDPSTKPSQTLFLGDLSRLCDEKDVMEAFKQFGEIVNVRIMRSKKDGQCLGYGFISFVSVHQAIRAKEEMNGKVLVGRQLSIRYSSRHVKNNKSSSPPTVDEMNDHPHQQQHPQIETAEVHFSFITKHTNILITEATIRAIFGEFGAIQDIRLKKHDRKTGLGQSGYGFVHYPLTADGISAALQASWIICQLNLDEVLYDCSLTHEFVQFLDNGGFDLMRGKKVSSPSLRSMQAAAPMITKPTSPHGSAPSSPPSFSASSITASSGSISSPSPVSYDAFFYGRSN